MDIVDLREIEESNETTNQIAIFRIIKDNLTSSASSTDAKVDLISSSLIRLCSSESTPAAKDAFRMEFWFMVVDIARYLPPNHPWQQILVGVVSNLRNYGGQNGDIDLAKWWDLSKFTMYLFDHWSDPTDMTPGYYSQDDVAEWKNLNSFLARLTSTMTGCIEWASLPVYEISKGLERPLENLDVQVVDCRIWICTEWILCAGPSLCGILCGEANKEEADQTGRQSIGPTLATGPLAKGLPAQSKERWDFWTERLTDLAEKYEELKQIIAEALRQMDCIKSGSLE